MSLCHTAGWFFVLQYWSISISIPKTYGMCVFTADQSTGAPIKFILEAYHKGMQAQKSTPPNALADYIYIYFIYLLYITLTYFTLVRMLI